MKILAIETSCDDTCIAILEIKKKKLEILSNIVSSQVKLHAKYGGIYPSLAKREHQCNLLPVLVQALKQSKLLKISNFKFLISKQILNSNFQIPKPNIDLIAVTNGPGLEPCLWTGINFAKELAEKWGLPIIPVNHIKGHIFANFVSSNEKRKTKNEKLQQKIEFPAICLIVSGGHTQLILMKSIDKYKILGETRDDAAGECFDKTARILGLGYPGGPAIAAEAAKFQITNTKLQISTKFKITNSKPRTTSLRGRQILNSTQSYDGLPHRMIGAKFNIKLPRPMIYQKNYDFSFSGLKTAVLYEVRKKKRKSKKFVQLMALEIQQAIIDVLIYKTIKAAKDYRVKTIILGGGVISNNELRKQFKTKIKKEKLSFKYASAKGAKRRKECETFFDLQIPNSKLCTDNAAMIGIAAFFNRQKKTKNFKNIKADANMKIQ